MAAENGIAPVLETLPADELPAGVPAAPEPQRSIAGRFQKGNATARQGGLAKAGYKRMAASLGLAELPEGSPVGPYRKHARDWRDAVAADMARTIGGGIVGPMASSFLDSAAHALLWSRYLADLALTTGDHDLATKAAKHAEASSRLVREAWEYVAREAEARESSGDDGLAAARAAFQRQLAEGSGS
jgi:hypothetical protein